VPNGPAERARARAQVFFLDSLKLVLTLYGHKLLGVSRGAERAG